MARLAHTITVWALVMLNGPVFASSITTQWQRLAHTVSGKIETYMMSHDGAVPETLEELFTDGDKALLETQLAGTLSSKILYLGTEAVAISKHDDRMLAVLTFPIVEDRRDSVGRYVVFIDGDGKVGSRWEREDAIQFAATSAGITLPTGQLFEETPLNVQYPEYGMRLVEEAVKDGVPADEAAEIVQRHVDDVIHRRATAAESWSELKEGKTANRNEPNPRSATSPAQNEESTPQPPTDKPTSPTETPEAEKPNTLLYVLLGLLVVAIAVVVLRKARKS